MASGLSLLQGVAGILNPLTRRLYDNGDEYTALPLLLSSSFIVLESWLARGKDWKRSESSIGISSILGSGLAKALIAPKCKNPQRSNLLLDYDDDKPCGSNLTNSLQSLLEGTGDGRSLSQTIYVGLHMTSHCSPAVRIFGDVGSPLMTLGKFEMR